MLTATIAFSIQSAECIKVLLVLNVGRLKVLQQGWECCTKIFRFPALLLKYTLFCESNDA